MFIVMKKEEKKPVDDAENTLASAQQPVNDLEEELKKAQKHQDDKKYRELEERIVQLEKENKELEEIAKRSQYEYINLKMDFDRYQRQTKESSQSMELDSLLSVVKKFLPFIEDLRKSLANITDEHKEDPLTK